MTSVRYEFPYEVDVVAHTWITMDDGVRLSAKLWRPRTNQPVPVLLEYLPYRKDDFTYDRDSAQHGYFAGHGYATARVDIRGTGDSDGILEDEYLQSELDDGVAVIEWLAGQEWCDGRVGMFGISWGGFNSLQVAAMAPPSLKAVIAVAATDDRYATDVHYCGGAVLACEMLPWAATMLVRNAIPPTPAIVGDRWREKWLRRLEDTPRFIESWLSHQRRDEFWQHGSVGDDLTAIECPVYIVGGLADGYRDTVLRVAAGTESRALLGPWSHNFPEMGVPGPNIGFLQEALRWWNHWLRDIDTGMADDDRVRIWIQDWADPTGRYSTRPGRWITEATWPPPPEHVSELRLWPAADGLAAVPAAPVEIPITGAQSHGAYGGRWWGYGGEGDLARDQQLEKAAVTRFDSAPVDEVLDVVGVPEVHLRVSSDSGNAIVTAQLSDVAPDGRALLVAKGVLNLSHRTSHEHPAAMIADQPTDVTVALDATAHRIEPGHRWRLTVSTTYWPLIWPLPNQAPLTIHLGPSSQLTLPVRSGRAGDAAAATFGPPEQALSDVVERTPPIRTREVTVADAVTTITDVDQSGEFEIPGRVVASMGVTDTFSIRDGDPLSARVTSTRRCDLEWPEARVNVATRSEMWATADRWHVVNSIEAHENGATVFNRTWEFDVARDWA